MRKNKISISTVFSAMSIIITLSVVAISSATTAIFFSKECLDNFYSSAEAELSEFSDSISMFFGAKEIELNVFAESEQVKAADNTIHSFVNEVGEIQILDYEKSPVEEKIRSVCKSFAKSDSDIAEIYLGTKWGGYATNFDSSMSGGYDPRKRGWYVTATKGNGKVMITDAFASTVGATVVGITRSAYDRAGSFIGNASIEVSLDTLTKILARLNFGKDSFVMMLQKDGTILADTSPAKNNFKNIADINIPELEKALQAHSRSGQIKIGKIPYFTHYVNNPKTAYQIIALCPDYTVYKAFRKTLNSIVAICALFTVIVALVSALVTRKIIKPLKTIRNGIIQFADQIAAGNADLGTRVVIKSKNEIGDVADGFNVFSEKLQDIIKNMKQSKDSLISAGHLLKDGTEGTSTAIGQIASAASGVEESISAQSASVEQTSGKIRSVIENVGELERLVGNQTNVAQKASAAIEEMISNISEVKRSVDNMAQSFEAIAGEAESGEKTQTELQAKINEIEEQSKLLNEANSVIANIAAQTNLLAMNAAIEAAHAGDSGKGFAVVADEIRKLSETSSAQSKTIGEQLKRISENIVMVVQATQRGVQGYAQLANEIQKTDSVVRKIKDSMDQQESGSAKITDSLRDMNSSSQQARQSSKKMADESQEIMSQIMALQEKTSSMKRSMDEMSQNAEKIKDAGATLSNISSVMEKSIGEIGSQIDQFKV
ncbi:MAG: HAMP domain-containing protein [Treponema sp.]|nr:HAMP domain-containing protein [Treponema sp.]